MKEIAEAQELLNIFHRLRHWPVCDSANFVRVYVYPLGIYVMPKESGALIKEGTLLEFTIEFILL